MNATIVSDALIARLSNAIGPCADNARAEAAALRGVQTWAAVASQVSDASPGALETLRRLTADARSAARLAATRLAAFARVPASEATQQVVLLLDIVGAGGTAGATGGRSARLLSELGAGRWQARDSNAWLSAAYAALATDSPDQTVEPSDVVAAVTHIPEAREAATALCAQVLAALLGVAAAPHERLAFSRRADAVDMVDVAARGSAPTGLCRCEGTAADWAACLSTLTLMAAAPAEAEAIAAE